VICCPKLRGPKCFCCALIWIIANVNHKKKCFKKCWQSCTQPISIGPLASRSGRTRGSLASSPPSRITFLLQRLPGRVEDWKTEIEGNLDMKMLETSWNYKATSLFRIKSESLGCVHLGTWDVYTLQQLQIRYFLYSIVISDLITSDLQISPTHTQLLANHPNASRSPKCTCLLFPDRFWLTLRREGDVHARCILVGFKCCCATSGSQCGWDLASHIRFLNKLWSAEICLVSWDLPW